jgi:hypothetical protein
LRRKFPIKKTFAAILTALLAVPGQAAAAAAANCIWNPAAGNWSVAASWSCPGSAVPGAADTATIAGGKVVTVDTAQSILNLTNSGGVNIDATLLTLQGSGSTTNTGTLNVGSAITAALQVSASHNINNTDGVINVANGSVVNQFGSTITGGTINTTGTGKLVAFNTNSNVLTGVTLNGTLDLATGTSIERVVGGLTLNGAVNVNSNSILSFVGDQSLDGSGTIVLGNTGASNRALMMEGNTTLTVGQNVLVHGVNGTLGQAYLAGGTQQLINNGTINSDGGNVNASAGFTGTGTVSAIGTGVLTIGVNSGVGNLLNNGSSANALNLGTHNITVSGNNNNANFGAGNSFNSHANVAGTGQILAATGTSQGVSGTGVSNGDTAEILIMSKTYPIPGFGCRLIGLPGLYDQPSSMKSSRCSQLSKQR